MHWERKRGKRNKYANDRRVTVSQRKDLYVHVVKIIEEGGKWNAERHIKAHSVK